MLAKQPVAGELAGGRVLFVVAALLFLAIFAAGILRVALCAGCQRSSVDPIVQGRL
jgi:hypothetical protein